MAAGVVKFAISLPKRCADDLDKLQKKLKLSRSAAVAEAVRLWIRRQEIAEMERRYVAGYRKKPERPADSEALFRAGMSTLFKEEW